MSLEEVESRIQQLQTKVRGQTACCSTTCERAIVLCQHASQRRRNADTAASCLQVEADEQKLMRLQTGTELISAEERQKVEAVRVQNTYDECATRCANMHLSAHCDLCLACRLQKFAANMQHWQKRRKIFKSIW